MASSSSSSSASTPSWKYDVFLSFMGEDTRRNFTGHLHDGLERFGIKTFIDYQLRRGEQISSELLQAIEDSRFSIIIFSQNYASSSSCLDELTKILECVDKGKHTAFPVFFEVDPSHVRHQRGSYEEAFKKHEKAHKNCRKLERFFSKPCTANKNNMERVMRWREALARISGYSGWDTRNKNQVEVIKEIVDKFFNELSRFPSSSNKIGIDSHIRAVLSLLCIGSHDVRMVGIWGMAGIGKTTLAEAIYQRIHTQFEGYCFLSNVREKSQKRIENLQMDLLSNILREKNLENRIFNSEADSIKKVLHSKKVLIILDDVNHIKQLEELAGNCNWFGPKSRIMITTRDKHLLIEKDVDAIYEVEELERDEALTLFCQHAFKDKLPPEDFKELCDHSLDYTKGNPLAIKILGNLLFKRTKKEWDCELEKLKKFPNKDIQGVLRISFDGLEDNVKDIFLDIACSFKEEDKDYVLEILESCDLYPEMGISTLIENALITISDNNTLCMHDLIQEMGWEIVRQQSIEDPGKRSRLWLNEDIEDVLTTNRGTETIQVIVLDLSNLEELLDFNVDVFTKMINLRVLIFHFRMGRPPPGPYQIHLKGDFKFPGKNLRCLTWEGYPLKYLPSSFNPRKLFRLNMSFSKLEQLWEGNKSFGKLRYIDLSYSQDLIRTPDLSGCPELRELYLEGCTSLVEVHPSIETLEKLGILNLENCSKLEELAKSFRKLTSLERVQFNDCLELRKLPDDLTMRCQDLNLSDCSKLEELPNSIGKLTHLCFLDLRRCSKIKKLPDEMGDLQSFVADGSGIQEIPLLTSLEHLSLARCNSGNLALSSDMSSLCCLVYLDLSGNNFITLPSLTPLARLLWLRLEGCKSLRLLTKLPSSIETICARNCESLETFSHPPNSHAMSESQKLLFDFSNCGRLLENEESSVNNLEAILDGIRIVPRSHFLRYRRAERWFDVLVPGSRIPEWFTHRSQGNSIIVHQLPPDFHALNCLKLAFCVVLPGNISQWDSDHLRFGIVSAQEIQEEMLGKCVSHLKFSVSYKEDDGKAPLVVKEYGIRLLYQLGEEYDNTEEINEYESVNATGVSPPPTFNEKPCWETTIRAYFGNLIIQWELSYLIIEVEGYNIYALEPTMTTSLTQDSNQSKGERQ